MFSEARDNSSIITYRGRWGTPGRLGGGGGRMGLHNGPHAISKPILEPNIAVFNPIIHL